MAFQVQGLNEVFHSLTRASSTIKGRARDVVEQTIGEVTATAKSIAPVLSGETRDSIDDEVIEGGGRVVGISGPSTRQAIFAEWGTSVMAPRAFMGPALDRHSVDFIDRLEREVGDVQSDSGGITLMVVSSREHTDAVVAALEADGLTVGDADAKGLEPPYVVVYPIAGGGYSGTLAEPTKDAELVRQVSGVGLSRDQAEWLADRAMEILDGLQVENRLICRVHPESTPGTFVDRDVTPIRFVCPVRFQITTTPS